MSYKWNPYVSMDDFRKTVVQPVQATRFESLKLWQAREGQCEWISIPEGRLVTIGHSGDKPVALALEFAVIDGKRTLFWEMTSMAWDSVIAENWIKANCHPEAQALQMFPELTPIPMQEDEAGARRELEKVVYFIESGDREAQLVQQESRNDADIKLDPTAYGVKIGEVGGKPVVMKLLFATVNSRRIVFWMPGSTVFDFAMGEEWLNANSTLLATTESAVRTDAMNFHNCVHDINRMNEREVQPA